MPFLHHNLLSSFRIKCLLQQRLSAEENKEETHPRAWKSKQMQYLHLSGLQMLWRRRFFPIKNKTQVAQMEAGGEMSTTDTEG